MKNVALVRSRLPRMAATVALISILVVLGWSLLLASVGLGIAHGEARVNPQYERESEIRMGRAASLGVAAFVIVQFVLGSVAFTLDPFRSVPIHWIWRFCGVVLVGSVGCYALVLITLFMGGAPDPIESLRHVLTSWLLGASSMFR